jgi:hypothetical protein
MKLLLALTLIACGCTAVAQSSATEDPQLRQEAVRLMERAAAASSPLTWPDLKRVDSFRAYGPQGERSGVYSRTVQQNKAVRNEAHFGTYAQVEVWHGRDVQSRQTGDMFPPELDDVWKLTPVRLMHFDDTDLIHAIRNDNVNGRAARCIAFETVTQHKSQLDNEFCVDAENGAFLRDRTGNELVEYSDYFPFAGAYFPAHIRYSVDGKLKTEIDQSMRALTADDMSDFVPPANAEHKIACGSFRRPLMINSPQPKPGNGGNTYEVVVRGLVKEDGHLYGAVVQSSEREDLNSEALAVADQWTFTPGMCDARPNQDEVEINLHFVNR